MSTLNRRNDLASCCRHARKFLLKNVFTCGDNPLWHVTQHTWHLFYCSVFWNIFDSNRYFWQLPDDCSTTLSSERAIAVIFQVISVLPFSAKNAFVTAYLLESPPARFKNVAFYFQTISCLLRFGEGNEWISSAVCSFSPLWKRTRSSQMYSPEIFQS